MKGVSTWSYTPYKPLMFDVGDLYICRVAPQETCICLEWLPGGDGHYTIFYRLRSQGAFENAGESDQCTFVLTHLKPEQEYEFFVVSAGLKSRIRLARTGQVVGTVVNYLHPEDSAYAFSGQALCSPSLVRCPDGSLLASMDLYAHQAPQNLTLLYRSRDNGQTWHYVSDLFPCFWGKLFVHRGDVYMLATSTEYGDLLISRSPDNGETFPAPVVLMRGSCHFARPGVHKNPQNLMHFKERLYATLEWGCWAGGVQHAAMVMSCHENDDLLDPANWHFTPPVAYDPAWPGTAKGPSTGTLEGTLAVLPDGNLYNIMRYGIQEAEPSYGRVLAYRVNTEDPDAPVGYSHAIELPGNHSKFTIRQDPQTGRYYTIISRILNHEMRNTRNLLSLMLSEDGQSWRLVCDLIDRRHEDPKTIGFQYVDFDFDGDDLIFLCRTAMNHARNYHDANYSTFHRLKGFRNLKIQA